MRKLIMVALAASTLAGCASDAQWAASDPRNRSYVTEGQVVGTMNPDTAMADACRRKRAAQAIDAKWDAYCKARGL